MKKRVAIIGAGVSGLTSAVLFAERGYGTTIFAEETGVRTTSGAAAAIWYPYDAEPAEKVIAWALETYNVFIDLSRDPRSGVSMIELRNFSRAGEIQIPAWAHSLGARPLRAVAAGLPPASRRAQRDSYSVVDEIPPAFTTGFALKVPLTDTTRYLDYLKGRLTSSGGSINDNVRFEKLEDVSRACHAGAKRRRDFDLVVNCSGIGARTLVRDADLEPHRGQVAIVPKLPLPCAIVCDDAPLMYAIPRANDCVFGGTNELSGDRTIDSASTRRIVAECSRILDIDEPKVLRECVGLRPFRKSGVRVEVDRLRDGRIIIHNYGHGGAGFTLSWGCAANVLALAEAAVTMPNE